MSSRTNEFREQIITMVAVTVSAVVSATLSRGVSGWFSLLGTIVIGAVVGLLARWLLYRARLRDHLPPDSRS
ncbi:hypothetical protein ACH5BA_29960 [Kitasatospora sp. NPDC018623]|uniref:hypothetical protein n=1 Tax=Kitasatospora sp. NPDC018623 TaxID=3364029 RepID=UPI00378E6F3E